MSKETPAEDTSAFRFSHPLRVRWAECDPQAIVFNPHYLAYFDTAVTEYWRAIDCGYPTVFTEQNVEVFAIKASVEFRKPAVFDDVIDVRARVAGMGRSSMRFAYQIGRGDELLVVGELVYVFTDREKRLPTPIPQLFRDAITRYETVPPEEADRRPRGDRPSTTSS